MPTLWMTDCSPPASAVRIFAEILGVPLDYVNVDFSNKQHKSPEILKINPVGTVPILKDGDFYLTDSHALLKYLLEKYGSAEQKALYYPSNLETRALIDQAMFFDTGVYFIKVKLAALPALFGDSTGPTPTLLEEIDAAYAVVETYLGSKKYIVADHPTLADISLGITTESLQPVLKLDKKKFPHVAAWLDRLNQIPAFKKYAGPGFVGDLGAVLNGAWEKNKQKQK